ncbi:MAG: HNH endonuclease signature motif containing protein [Acidimicrobiales bacterium]
MVIHVNDHVLSGIVPGNAELAEAGGSGAGFVSRASARRLACDSRYCYVADGANGSALGVGRMTRSIPAWLYRVLRHRDRGCRFPGCGQGRLIHAHHIRHWADGGPTEQGNLILICRYHHRLVHEGGWSITGDACGEVSFVRPDGTTLASRPTGPRPEVLARLFDPGGSGPGSDPPEAGGDPGRGSEQVRTSHGP